jgi:hypothetical protein
MELYGHTPDIEIVAVIVEGVLTPFGECRFRGRQGDLRPCKAVSLVG